MVRGDKIHIDKKDRNTYRQERQKYVETRKTEIRRDKKDRNKSFHIEFRHEMCKM